MAESALRQYEYGGEGLFGAFMPSRREVISPEQRLDQGYTSTRRGPGVDYIPVSAKYGEPESGFEYTPVVRGIKSALNYIGDAFSDPQQAIESVQTVAPQALGGLNQYMKDQYTAGALGGTSYDPQTGQVTEFNPVDAATMLAPSGFLTRAAATPGSVVLGMVGSKNATHTPKQREAIKQLDARGWDTDKLFLHGTASDYDDAFKASETGDLGPGFYTTGQVFDDAGEISTVMSRSGNMETVPDIANRYANIRKFMRPEQRGSGAPNTRPVVYKKDLNFLDVQGGMVGPVDAERVNALKAQGYDGIRVIDPNTGNVAQTNVFDPDNVRSALDYSIPDTPAQGQSALRGVFSTTDRNAVGMIPNMVDYQTAGILSRDPNYFKESKDVDYEIRNMSPDEYLERGAAILRPEGETIQDVIDGRAKESGYINNMVRSMQGGQVYAAPYLDYGSGGRGASQEGMHRALAAKQLGMEEIPVMVLDSYKNPRSPYRSALNETDAPATNPSALRELDLSYRGQHESPSADYGAPLHDLTQMIPEDVYGSSGQRLYGLGDNKVDAEVFSTLRAVKGLPDSEVVTYRAVPLDVNDINPGDWVTTSKEYAVQHGESALGGNYQILEQKAKAKDLFTAGDVQEYGWNPEGIKVIDNSFNRLSPPKNETLGELADRLGDIYKSNPNNRQFRLDWLDARKRRDSLGADILANP